MSTGDFRLTSCEDRLDAMIIYPILLQPETLDATINGAMNAAPTGAPNQMISAWVGKKNRQPGFRPAMANFKWAMDGPANYTGRGGRFPLLTKAIYEKATKGATGTYLTKPIIITGVTDQDYG